MGRRIDQFCDNLRTKLTSIDNSLASLKANIDSNARTAEEQVRDRLLEVNRLMEQNRARVIAAQADINKWAEESKSATRDAISDWKAKAEKVRLQSRALLAEAYADAASILAMATVDQAEKAALEAWLARKDADTAQEETKAA